MHIACDNGDIEIVKMLLAYGARDDDKNNVSTMYNMINVIVMIVWIRMEILHGILLLIMVILTL